LSRLKDPQKYLGPAPISGIFFINVSVTGEQAGSGIYSDVMHMVDSSPYFDKYFKRNRKINSILQFPKKIIFKAGNSSEFSAIGKNVFCADLDEASFFGIKHGSSKSIDASGEYDAAQTLYDALIRRIKLTFTNSGISSGMGFLLSSARYPGDFIEKKIEKLEKAKAEGIDDGTTVVKSHTVWEVKDPSAYIKPKFRVEVGDKANPSRIIPDGTPAIELLGKRILEVPGEFRQIFFENIDSALRDLGGVATLSISPFIRDKTKIAKIFVKTYKHPYSEITSTDLGGYLKISPRS